jgi:hypothetical protein
VHTQLHITIKGFDYIIIIIIIIIVVVIIINSNLSLKSKVNDSKYNILKLI